MLKISLYQNFCVGLCVIFINTYDYRKNQSYTTDRKTTSAIGRGLSQRQEPCIPYALPCNPSEIARSDIKRSGVTNGHDPYFRQLMGETLRDRRHLRFGDTSWTWSQAYNGLLGRGDCTQSHRTRQAEGYESQGGLAESIRQGGEREHLQGFFIRIGARYRRIRKRPKGQPSPQLYAYKTEKQQELERQANGGLIDLYYGDESHICTEGYVPYGWQFPDENVYIPSQRGYRLNIFGMIGRNNRYEGFSTSESITVDKVADFLDRFSLRIEKNTFVVLDNASIHCGRLISELRPIWEKRGFFSFSCLHTVCI